MGDFIPICTHHWRRGGRAARAVAAMIVALVAGPAMADESDASVLMSFVAGDYALVGRGPENGAPYAGTAKIAEDGEQLILERQIGGRTMRAVGRVEVPSPPGEARYCASAGMTGRRSR